MSSQSLTAGTASLLCKTQILRLVPTSKMLLHLYIAAGRLRAGSSVFRGARRQQRPCDVLPQARRDALQLRAQLLRHADQHHLRALPAHQALAGQPAQRFQAMLDVCKSIAGSTFHLGLGHQDMDARQRAR